MKGFTQLTLVREDISTMKGFMQLSHERILVQYNVRFSHERI